MWPQPLTNGPSLTSSLTFIDFTLYYYVEPYLIKMVVNTLTIYSTNYGY